ncbi:MAG: division plane positioning ATPase MipZ [Alphaproteobacteria bacterium]|jgi:chromosome partitioning protein
MNQSSSASSAPRRGHIIVIGNEKGGSGKTTTTLHLMVSLLRLGFKVGSMDIDARQRSLTRYLENRKVTIAKEGVPLPMPQHVVVNKSPYLTQHEVEADERDRFTRALAKLLISCDFVIIDAPGNDTYLSRLAHSFADTVLTPINDSFVDLDVLATVDGNTLEVIKPSIYSEMLWEQKMLRVKRDGGSIDWIVMRNRLSNIDARNKRMITQVMESLAKRIGFRQAPGFSERVIFREMFLLGLTVLDVTETTATSSSLSMSHLAARQEVRELLKALRIPAIDQRISDVRAVAAQTPVAASATAVAASKAASVLAESAA